MREVALCPFRAVSAGGSHPESLGAGLPPTSGLVPQTIVVKSFSVIAARESLLQVRAARLPVERPSGRDRVRRDAATGPVRPNISAQISGISRPTYV